MTVRLDAALTDERLQDGLYDPVLTQGAVEEVLRLLIRLRADGEILTFFMQVGRSKPPLKKPGPSGYGGDWNDRAIARAGSRHVDALGQKTAATPPRGIKK